MRKPSTANWYSFLRGARFGWICIGVIRLLEAYFGYDEPVNVLTVYWWLLGLIWLQLLSITLCLKNILMAYLSKARLEIQNYE